MQVIVRLVYIYKIMLDRLLQLLYIKFNEILL